MPQHQEDKKEHKKNPESKRSEQESKKKDKNRDKKIKKLEQEKQELEKQYQRALADYHNLLKRQVQEKEGLTKYANENLLQELLPVFDHLKLSLEHVSEENKDDQWVQGVVYVVKQFREVLEENGVKEIKAEGEKFNPEYMEAVEGEGDVVQKEIKPGYTLNGKTIIPAKVVVKQGTGLDQESESREGEEIGN
ncbi:MAG TPA: nucleotide exchange factor GrpE [Patescibacteria group bacterium]|nr:nucleotide exchange factor GrpE [Patescibacteria group bacterium]